METIIGLLLMSSFTAGNELKVGMDGTFIPQKDSVYICGAVALDEHPYYYLTSFTPVIKPGKIHHLGIFGCNEPGSKTKYWNSMDNMGKVQQDGLPLATLCKNPIELELLYAWSYNTSSLVLPEDAAYEVGWNTTKYRYLVFEIHYPHVSAYEDGVGDDSHVIVKYQLNKPTYAAGYLMSAPIDPLTPAFPPHRNSTLDLVILIPSELHPSLYQVHTHLIGTKVSGYDIKMNRNKPKDMKWTQIGMRDPMIPQLWVPVDNNITMEPGDLFAVRCHYYNYRDTPTTLGSSEEEEMCNFYIIYWSKWEDKLPMAIIPLEKQASFKELGLTNIPDDA